jgi:Protein of unknown function (DUF3500)
MIEIDYRLLFPWCLVIDGFERGEGKKVKIRMKKLVLLSLAPVLAVVCGYFVATADTSGAAPKRTKNAEMQAIEAATSDFLNSLGPAQREKVQFPFTAQKTATAAKFKGGMNGRMTFVGEQYGQAVWSNFPVSDVPRPGLTLGSLSVAQHDAAMHLLQVLLSPKGYQKVLDIMGSDQALSESGTPFSSGASYYTIGIFGTPSTNSPWMLEFGGHHLALNITMSGEHGVLTPTLTGAQPAVYTSNGKTVRALAQESDKAFALLNALDDAQRKQAILNYLVNDLVLGLGHEGETIQPEGLKAAAMNQHQQTMLLDLISEWAGIINDAYATPRMTEIKAGIADTYFAWSGPLTHEQGKNGAAYYRIQGPKLVIEFSPQGVGGDPTMHVHTMYRDPTNDYGRGLGAE